VSELPERQRVERRIEVVAAVLWGVEHGRELFELVSRSTDRRKAVMELTRTQGLSEFAAQHVIDLCFGQCSQLGRQHLRDGLDELRRALGDSA
jgi:DNA gyrase/topoisomerase IV subunit A